MTVASINIRQAWEEELERSVPSSLENSSSGFSSVDRSPTALSPVEQTIAVGTLTPPMAIPQRSAGGDSAAASPATTASVAAVALRLRGVDGGAVCGTASAGTLANTPVAAQKICVSHPPVGIVGEDPPLRQPWKVRQTIEAHALENERKVWTQRELEVRRAFKMEKAGLVAEMEALRAAIARANARAVSAEAAAAAAAVAADAARAEGKDAFASVSQLREAVQRAEAEAAAARRELSRRRGDSLAGLEAEQIGEVEKVQAPRARGWVNATRGGIDTVAKPPSPTFHPTRLMLNTSPTPALFSLPHRRSCRLSAGSPRRARKRHAAPRSASSACLHLDLPSSSRAAMPPVAMIASPSCADTRPRRRRRQPRSSWAAHTTVHSASDRSRQPISSSGHEPSHHLLLGARYV